MKALSKCLVTAVLAVNEAGLMVIIVALSLVLLWLLGFISTVALASVITALFVVTLVYLVAREMESRDEVTTDTI